MEYRHSRVVDPSTYSTEGLCEGIPLRAHRNPECEDYGTLRAQEDWRKHVAPMGEYRGGLGPEYSFMTVAVPECLPDRLEIISYANEFAFLHDDVTDIVNKIESDKENDRMQEAFLDGAKNGSIDSKGSGKRYIQSQMLLEMIAIDHERAMTTMKVWAKFVENAAGRQHTQHFATLEEYIPYRSLDVGQMFWFGMVTFGMGITIPDQEMAICEQLCRSAWVTASLTNDLFSWPKEHEAAIKAGQAHVVNAIWVMMGEHKISEDAAKALCRKKIKENVAEYVRVVERSKLRTDLSLDLRRYIESLQYSLSGNVVWSLRCPRYHPEISYSKSQREWMTNGIPRSLNSKKERRGRSGSTTEASKRSSSTVGFDSVNGKSMKRGVKRPVGDVQLSNSASKPDGKPQFNGIKRSRRLSEDTDEPNGIGRSNDGLGLHENHRSNGVEKSRNSKAIDESSTATQNLPDAILAEDLPDLDEEVIMSPFNYLKSLPSKGVREQLIDAMNIWYEVPAEELDIIKRAIGMLHALSLMLDDIEDHSPLRRGKPSTHTIFGNGQTINSANFQIVRAMSEIQQLDSPECLSLFLEELKNLFIGQSLDLYWTSNLVCPSVNEYLKMVDNKTGGLFRLLARLMNEMSTTDFKMSGSKLPTLTGRYFQIRDDYQNLVSKNMQKQKGFCEDLDEGKFSLTLIHALEADPKNLVVRNILMQRRVVGHSNDNHKELILGHIAQTKSLEYTRLAMQKLHTAIEEEIGALEDAGGVQNPLIRLMLARLQV